MIDAFPLNTEGSFIKRESSEQKIVTMKKTVGFRGPKESLLNKFLSKEKYLTFISFLGMARRTTSRDLAWDSLLDKEDEVARTLVGPRVSCSVRAKPGFLTLSQKWRAVGTIAWFLHAVEQVWSLRVFSILEGQDKALRIMRIETRASHTHAYYAHVFHGVTMPAPRGCLKNLVYLL